MMKQDSIRIRISQEDKAELERWARRNNYGNLSEAIRHTLLTQAREDRDQEQAA